MPLTSFPVSTAGTARAAAGSDGEVLLAVLDGPLLIGTCNQVLEADGVGDVEMMGLIGMGNNPMVGATVACAVAAAQANA